MTNIIPAAHRFAQPKYRPLRQSVGVDWHRQERLPIGQCVRRWLLYSAISWAILIWVAYVVLDAMARAG